MTKFNNATEAFEHVILVLKKLQEVGVQVTLKPSNSRESATAKEKYGNDPQRIPVDRWQHATLEAQSDEHRKQIFAEQHNLGVLGISFNTGGGAGYRDWELDWSFKYTGVEDKSRAVAQEAVEEMITKDLEGDKPKTPTA